MEYVVDDRKLTASVFLDFVNQVWQGDYDMERTRQALSRTLNITAYDDGKLIGCLRILTDGAQPGVEGFYEKNGCQKSLQSYIIEKRP